MWTGYLILGFSSLYYNYIFITPHILNYSVWLRSSCKCMAECYKERSSEVQLIWAWHCLCSVIKWDLNLSFSSFLDPIQSLSFIEYYSTKKPALLKPLFSTLCSFLSSPVSQIRNSASTIILRYMRHDPSAANEALPILMDCLDSKNPDIVLSVLEKIPEVVVCSQGTVFVLPIFILPHIAVGTKRRARFAVQVL